MSTIIETKNASLSTMAVTIKALHVNSKQMTLAVFRQLPIIHAYNDDGSLLPLEHWGLVRYSIKDQGDVWLVCSKDGILYRASIENKDLLERPYTYHEIETAKRVINESINENQKKDSKYILEEHDYFLRDRESYRKSKQKLLELPQLFIAV